MDHHQMPLCPEVITPAPPRHPLLVATATIILGFLGLATFGVLSTNRAYVDFSEEANPADDRVCTVTAPVLPESTTPMPASAALAHRDHAMTISVGGTTYVQLAETEQLDKLPAHSSARYVKDDSLDTLGTAIADVEPSELPANLSGWLGENVIVDGICEATIESFHLVTLATGSFEYMGAAIDEHSSSQEKAAALFAEANVVVAARLDGCTRNIGYARSAKASLSMNGLGIDEPELAQRAREQLEHSTFAKQALRQADLVAKADGLEPSSDSPEFSTQVFRHPRTGDVFVSVQMARWAECGDKSINVWGLYKVNGESLEQLAVTHLGETASIDRAVDIDGDGTFEFMGYQLLSGRSLIDATGAVIDSVDTPFFGCPC